MIRIRLNTRDALVALADAANVGEAWAFDAILDRDEEIWALPRDMAWPYAVAALVAQRVQKRWAHEAAHCDGYSPTPQLPTVIGGHLRFGWGRTGMELWIDDYQRIEMRVGWWTPDGQLGEAPDGEADHERITKVLAAAGELGPHYAVVL